MTNLGDKGRGMGRFSGGVCQGGPVCSARMAHLALVAPVVRLALVAPVARFPLVAWARAPHGAPTQTATPQAGPLRPVHASCR
jgi:hypothetical protein